MISAVERQVELVKFYGLLDTLEQEVGGKRLLRDCSGRMNWPRRGVYFFFENGEERVDTGPGPRVVRVGTHALRMSSKTTLWGRLSQHRGTGLTGGGNHRASIFRLLVGTALSGVNPAHTVPTWGRGSTADRDTRRREFEHENRVSAVIQSMPFLWLEVADGPRPSSLRGFIERNAIALLSNFERNSLDTSSPQWLGRFCNRERVRRSGLWNQNHVDEKPDPGFLGAFEKLIREMRNT